MIAPVPFALDHHLAAPVGCSIRNSPSRGTTASAAAGPASSPQAAAT